MRFQWVRLLSLMSTEGRDHLNPANNLALMDELLFFRLTRLGAKTGTVDPLSFYP